MSDSAAVAKRLGNTLRFVAGTYLTLVFVAALFGLAAIVFEFLRGHPATGGVLIGSEVVGVLLLVLFGVAAQTFAWHVIAQSERS